MKDLANNISAAQSLAPAVRTSDTNGTGVDLQGFESATIIVDTGAEGVTFSGSVKIDFKLEESSDDSTYTAVTSATAVTDGTVDSNGVFLTLDDNAETPQIASIGYVGGARYIRVVADFTGSHSTGTPVAASVIKGSPRHNVDADSVSTV
jgi:hypothetical protein|tara:strand:+ start:3952 stop:4401 length:450 start_codon:yes stop_codon:yes gene_type:complete